METELLGRRRHPRQRVIQLVEIEACGVLEHLGEVLGIGQPSAVLGRGGAPATGREGPRGLRGRGAHLLDLQQQVPAVPVVVDVLEPVPDLLEDLVQSHVADRHSVVLPLLDVVGAQEQL